MKLNQFYVDNLIKEAISEDINYIDVSADYLIPEEQRNDSYFVAKADGVLCGIEVAMRVFSLLDEEFTYTLYQKDGENVKKLKAFFFDDITKCKPLATAPELELKVE